MSSKPTHNARSSKRPVAIVTPFYKQTLNEDELISLRHLRHYLGHYDRILMMPESMQVTGYDDFQIRRFPDTCFANIPGYSRLLLSREFYEAFADYEFMLIYQLDVLVFSDQLTHWCNLDYDYIGAPWLKSRQHPEKGFSRCGNGGFSLRKIESFLRVFDSPRYQTQPIPFWRDVLFARVQGLDKWQGLNKIRGRMKVLSSLRQGVRQYTQQYSLNEDHFWADRARFFDPTFNIAPVPLALKFAFEHAPRYCFEQNNSQLPFGCHAWARWDKSFWEPYLLPAPS